MSTTPKNPWKLAEYLNSYDFFFLAEGAMPSGAPAGGAELFEAGVVDQASMPMRYLR